jgi:ABC-2 type transport system ATP-binding protein
VAVFCNLLGIIDIGELLVNADVEQVMKQVRRQTMLNIGVTEKTDAAAKLLSDHPDVESVEPQGQTTTGKPHTLVVTLKPEISDYSTLASLLVEKGFRLTLFKEEELNLETAFLALTKGITA